MHHDDMEQLTERIFNEIRAVREAGRREYAHASDNAFDNFERTAALTGVTREQALLTFMLKHIDGITSYVKGHRSQREDVRGRIKDAITYLILLWGMVEESERVRVGEKCSRNPATCCYVVQHECR